MEAWRTLMEGGKEEVRLREGSRGVQRPLVWHASEVADVSVCGRADDRVEALRATTLDRVRLEMRKTSGNVAGGT